jgi:ferredoxin
MSSRRFNWKALRVGTQSAAAAAVVVYFLSLVYPLHVPWRPDLLFQLDPLTHLYLLISGQGVPQPVLALSALVLLLAVSRIFCGWACPLGALLDLTGGLCGRLRLLNSRHRQSKPTQLAADIKAARVPANLDIYILLSLLVLALFRWPLLWLLDPIVFSFKFLTVALLPVLDESLRWVFSGLDFRFHDSTWWPPVMDRYNYLFTAYQRPVYTDTTVFMLLAALILGLEFYQRRFWCRYICPLGALLRLSYRLHPLRRRIRPDCAYCLKCELSCHFGGSAEHDCLYCMECIHGCAPGQISFLPGGPVLGRGHGSTKAVGGTLVPQEQDAEQKLRLPGGVGSGGSPGSAKAAYRGRITGELQTEGISRRLLLEYAAAGLVAYPVLKLFDGRCELPVDFIRPPGVTKEVAFTELCIKCGQCLKACLTNGLQPSLVEAGLSGLWTPRLISRLGYCEYNCHLCGQVCPTGAIPPLELEAKQQQVLGIAFLDRDRCIPYMTVHNCTVCEEHCPTPQKAILLQDGAVRDAMGVPQPTLQPYVDPQQCIGCGICENVCPLPGQAAIRVFRTPPGTAFAPKDSTQSATESMAELGYGQ